MLQVTKIRPKELRVTGQTSELVLFYSFWQTKLWHDWADNLHLDSLRRQVQSVLRNIRVDKQLLLWNGDRQFTEAALYATTRCRAIGIELHHLDPVEVDE